MKSLGIKFKHARISGDFLKQRVWQLHHILRTALEICVWCAREGIETEGNENREKEVRRSQSWSFCWITQCNDINLGSGSLRNIRLDS